MRAENVDEGAARPRVLLVPLVGALTMVNLWVFPFRCYHRVCCWCAGRGELSGVSRSMLSSCLPGVASCDLVRFMVSRLVV